jgi:hypothetical protein
MQMIYLCIMQLSLAGLLLKIKFENIAALDIETLNQATLKGDL